MVCRAAARFAVELQVVQKDPIKAPLDPRDAAAVGEERANNGLVNRVVAAQPQLQLTSMRKW